MIRRDRKRGNRKRSLVKEWNLIVPEEILERLLLSDLDPFTGERGF